VPFLFTSGYDRTTLGAEFDDVQLWEKPIDVSAMACELTALILER
jgi:hypothetical protein